jgi:hypothetical protein
LWLVVVLVFLTVFLLLLLFFAPFACSWECNFENALLLEKNAFLFRPFHQSQDQLGTSIWYSSTLITFYELFLHPNDFEWIHLIRGHTCIKSMVGTARDRRMENLPKIKVWYLWATAGATWSLGKIILSVNLSESHFRSWMYRTTSRTCNYSQ